MKIGVNKQAFDSSIFVCYKYPDINVWNGRCFGDSLANQSSRITVQEVYSPQTQSNVTSGFERPGI